MVQFQDYSQFSEETQVLPVQHSPSQGFAADHLLHGPDELAGGPPLRQWGQHRQSTGLAQPLL